MGFQRENPFGGDFQGVEPLGYLIASALHLQDSSLERTSSTEKSYWKALGVSSCKRNALAKLKESYANACAFACPRGFAPNPTKGRSPLEIWFFKKYVPLET